MCASMPASGRGRTTRRGTHDSEAPDKRDTGVYGAGIVKAHKGRIWVESAGYDEEKLPGSTFIMQIPLAN